jgi:membrane protein
MKSTGHFTGAQAAPRFANKSGQRLEGVYGLLMEAITSIQKHNAFRFAAALAFYTVVSLAPLVIVVVGVMGLFFGETAARERLVQELGALVGSEGAAAVSLVLQNAQDQPTSIVATLVGIGAFFVALVGVYFELQAALNTTWGVAPKPDQSFLTTLRKMFLSFALMGVFGLLMLVSLAIGTVLSAVDQVLVNWQPELVLLWKTLNFLVSLGIALLVFALVFKFIPDVQISFSDVWVGAAITTVLFSVGRFLIGLYLGQSAVTSSYGAAGSIIVLLLWIYYTSLILFFGAELTRVYADRFGSKIRPAPDAVPLSPAQETATPA